MSKVLLIVESPSKCGKIEKLVEKCVCLSSCGHIYQLKKGLEAIDINKSFKPSYQLIPGKKKYLASIRKYLKTHQVYLATDPDREGEAIALHLAQELKIIRKAKRITFNEISKNALQKSLQNPRQIDINLCNAQKTRRILDRLMGFEISPLLWQNLEENNLSAGRCQSPALDLIKVKENKINNFKQKKKFKVKGKVKSKSIIIDIVYTDLIETSQIGIQILKDCIDAIFKIKNLDYRETQHSPSNPYTTSTLQQDASQKLGLSPKTTMSIAQKLYEKGCITYMRTDSTTISKEAQNIFKDKIINEFGQEYHEKRNFKSKIKNAQEAHECIRIIDPNMDIETISDNLQKKLYQLIYQRSIASQMKKKIVKHQDIKVVALKNDEIIHEFNGHQEEIIFEGYNKVYPNTCDKRIAELKEGSLLKLKQLECYGENEKPPARYTEASLVKDLEKSGIGRPSTFSNIISTLLEREYVEKGKGKVFYEEMPIWYIDKKDVKEKCEKKKLPSDKGKLILTKTGENVLGFLNNHFGILLDKTFTSKIENDLDKIARGEEDWVDIIKKFYNSFHPQVVTLSKPITQKKNMSIKFVTELGEDNLFKYGIKKTKYGNTFCKYNLNSSELKFIPICDKLYKNGERISLAQIQFLFTLPKQVYNNYTVHYGRYGFYIKLGDRSKNINEDLSNGVIPSEDQLDELFNKSDNKLIHRFSNISVMEGKYGPFIVSKGKFYKIPRNIDVSSINLEICKTIIENQ